MIASIFSDLYWQLTGIYGQQLWYWLAGLDCENNVCRGDLFIVIGLLCLGITAFFVLLFYVTKLERFKSWIWWLIILMLTALINLFVGFGITNNQRSKMNDWAIYGIDNVECPPVQDELVEEYSEDNIAEEYNEDEGCTCEQLVQMDGVEPLVTSATCWQFGLANSIFSAVVFLILSAIFKRFARGGVRKHSPWRSLWP